MTIQRFEDLRIWQKAIELDDAIYKLIRNHTGLYRDYALRDQMSRASGSIADNIAEGFERDGNRELLHYLMIAKGSLGELRSQLNGHCVGAI